MYVRIGFDLIYEVPVPQSLLLMLLTHPDSTARPLAPERLDIEIEGQPDVSQHLFTDCFGNRAIRIDAPPGKLRLFYDNTVYDSGLPEPVIDGARLHPIDELPNETLPFLLSSRYCEVDRLSQTAWDLFGKTPQTWERAAAVMDWVHGNVEFGYQYASASKTALDVYNERRGVCRDFQHLAITFLRAMNIPARYATGYLGDIGVPASPLAMDFSAWFEVYLGGRWYTLDARHHEPRIARVLMARGRDATDVALSTSFGMNTLAQFKVWTDEVTSPIARSEPVASVQIGPIIVPLNPMPVATT